MNLRLLFAFVACGHLIAIQVVSGASVSILTVPIANPGNAPDTTGYGAVAYNYRIGAHEVTYQQYVEFLNSKAASDPLQLWSSGMGNASGGLTRTGTDGNYSYSVKPTWSDRPVGYVNYFDGLRYINWLHNGRGHGDTETGAYTLLGGTPTPTNSADITRNPNATWFLPNLNEWYKAAFHQPADQGGDPTDYWTYATKNNANPTFSAVDADGNTTNPGANVINGAPTNGRIANVGGAGPLSASFYGTYDQSGNVAEWYEQIAVGTVTENRRTQGGGINKVTGYLRAGQLEVTQSIVHFPNVGFRVATIPEPGTVVLAAVGLLALVGVALRRARRAG